MAQTRKSNTVPQMRKAWKLYTAILFIGLIFVFSMQYGSRSATHLIQEHSTVFDALGNVKSEMNNAHIWYNAVFSDNDNNQIIQAERNIDKALKYVNSLIKQDTISGVVFYSVDEDYLTKNIDSLSVQINSIKAIGAKYFTMKNLTGKADGLPSELHVQMSNVSKSIEKIATLIRTLTAAELKKYEALQSIIIFLFIILQLMLLYSVYIYNKHRKHDYLSIQESYAKLQETYSDLEIAEGIIKENEERYKALVDNASVGIYEIDRNANFVTLNNACVVLHQFSDSQEIINSNYFDFVSKKDTERIKILFEEALNGNASEFEYLSQNANNNYQIISGSFIPLVEENGTVNMVMGVSRDITDIITYQWKLEKAKLLYSLLSEINQAIVRTTNKEELFNKTCKIFVEYGKFKLAWIGQVNSTDNMFRPIASFGGSNGYFKNLTFSMEDKKYSELDVIKKLMNNQIVIFNNIKDDHDYPFWREDALKAGFVSGAAIPIVENGNVKEILSIGSDELNYFGNEEIALLSEIGNDISFSLEKINSDIKRKETENAIENIAKGISSTVGIEFFNSTVKSLNGLINAATTYVGLFDYEKNEIKILSIYGDAVLTEGSSYSIEGTPCGIVLEEGNYCISKKLSTEFPNDKLFHDKNIEGYFGLKLVDSKNNTIGILVSLFTKTTIDEESIKSVYQIFSSRIAAELERKFTFDSLVLSEKKIESLIDQSPFAIALFNLDGLLVTANKAWCNIWKLEAEDVCGKLNVLTEPKFKLSPIYKKIKVGDTEKSDDNEIFTIVNYENETKYLSPKFYPLLNKAGDKENYVIFIEDVTLLRSLEKEREQSEIRYQNLYEQSNDAIYLLYNNKFEIINKKFTELFGYTLDEVNAEEFNFIQLISPKSMPIIKDRIKRSQAGEKLNPIYEFIAVSKDGKEIECETSVTYLDYKNGKATQGILRDITARNQAIIKLKDSEKSYRELFDNSEDAIYMMTEQGEFIVVNHGAEIMYGYDAEYFVGKTPEFISAPNKNDLSAVQEYHIKAWNGEPQTFEFWGLRKNGEIFPKDVTLKKGSYFGKDVIVAVGHDITERKRKNAIIRANELRYRSLFEASADSILLFNDKIIVDCNPRALTMFGCSRNEIVGYSPEKFYPELQPTGEDTNTMIREMKAKVLKGEIVSFEWELNRFDKSGFIADVSLSNIELDDEVFILAIIRDISEKKKAERELIEAREKAEASDKLKSEFLAQMSHEIRTPINTILSFSSLIKYELEYKVSSDLQESFVGIGNAGKRIIRTIDLILNMSELQANSYDYRPKVVKLKADIFDKLVHEYKQIAERKGLELDYNQSDEDFGVFADEYTINQIFSNLIDNAVKYTSEGGIKISFSNNVSNVEVIIKDSGIGISEDYLPRVFEAFSQEEQGYTRSFEGNGLGMALVKQYCEMNNADINIDSKKGEGTTFSVTFKLHK